MCGQWRECIALLGNGWGKKHKTVDYVFKYPESYLIRYALRTYDEMINRGYMPNYKLIEKALTKRMPSKLVFDFIYTAGMYNDIYPEHNEEYMQECLQNLKQKDIILNIR